MNNLAIIIEKNDGLFWGRIEGKGNFMPTGSRETIDALINDIKDCIEDYVEHEGGKDEYWSKIDLNSIK